MRDDPSERVADPLRLQALYETSLLDSPAEQAFDRLTRLAAELVRAPVALLSLVDRERQFLKSTFGLAEPWASRREAPLSHSFCQHVAATGQALVVADAREDALLRETAAVSELGIIAYAGVPILARGQAVGALCAIARAPRHWGDGDLALLRELAHTAEVQIAAQVATRALAERERLLDTLLDAVPMGIVLRDVAGAVLRTNPATEHLLGYSQAELLKTDLWAITHPEDLPGDTKLRDELLGGDRPLVTRIKRFRHADGHYIWARVSSAVLRTATGSPLGTVAVVEDVTAEQQAEEAIVRQARIYHTIARSIPRGAILLFDTELRLIAADGAELLASIGLEREALEGSSVGDIAEPGQRAELERLCSEALRGNSVEHESTRQGRALKTRIAPVWDDENIGGGIALVQDVTEEREQAERVRRAQALFEVAIANVRDGVVVLDAKRLVLYANRAYLDLFDLEPATVIGTTRADFIAHVAPRVAERQPFIEELERDPGPAGSSAEFLLVAPRLRHLRRTITPLELPDGPGFMAVWQDISSEKRQLAEQEREALTDALTGIPNRRAAEREIARAHALARRTSTPLSVALFDLDHFKQVNDRHGHGVGDEVLRRVAQAIDRAKRLTDTVTRWGGEEFLAVLPVPIDGASIFCERVRREVERLPCPGVGRVTVSAGVAELKPGEAPEPLLKRADERLYAAKAGGRNRVVAH
jgi:diguanylate cyclase (GGDEF)-like protein/PAS domain S-box-containing protein